VEGHLTNVFNKLEIKTRSGLTAALASPTRPTGSSGRSSPPRDRTHGGPGSAAPDLPVRPSVAANPV
jgi:hypothetical protein